MVHIFNFSYLSNVTLSMYRGLDWHKVSSLSEGIEPPPYTANQHTYWTASSKTNRLQVSRLQLKLQLV